jgi:predicted pyridoxine 5'-phosphate oxidase superfamily flavin-nucleotide-binding protein
MMKSFGTLAFSESVKALQERYGSRKSYERIEKQAAASGLTEVEKDFIGNRDSFYMASIGKNGFPYIQHRGGPKGFVKVINKNTIGFIDFSGNRQFITVGNLASHNKVSVLMMDYPARARLKMYATASIVELNEEPELLKVLSLDQYRARPERMTIMKIEAYDWNCPQHITPRFTMEEIGEALAPQRDYISRLEAEIKTLKTK